MRPKRKTYTLAAASVTGYASNVTGATWALDDTTGPADGLGHLVAIHNDSTTNHTGKTVLLTGTDPEGRVLTETLALPDNAATVTSTSYFATLTSAVPSATIGADTMDIGWSAACATPMYPVDMHRYAGPELGVDIGGTVTFTCQQTNDDPFNVNPVKWSTMGTASQTADYFLAAGTAGATAVRVTVASHTSGTLAISFSQGR